MKEKFTSSTAVFLFLNLFVIGGTLKAQVSNLTEGFETLTLATSNTTTPVAGWTAKNNSDGAVGEAWFAGSSFQTLPFLQVGTPHGGSQCIATNFECGDGTSGVTLSNWLISPLLNLNNGAKIRFWTVGSSGSATSGQEFADNLQVRLSTQGTSVNVGTSTTSVGDFTTQLLEINPTLSTSVYPIVWTSYTITVSGLSGPTTGRIAFRYFVTNGGPAGSNSDAIMIDDVEYGLTGLPVLFSQFKGEKQNGLNKLEWTTSTEINSSGFELQRSLDGSNFSSLSFIASKSINGNSNSNLDYEFLDTKALITGYYYRLKQIDKDGKATLSGTVFIKGSKVTKLDLVSVYPNPVVQTLNLLIASPKEDRIVFVISNLAGKIVMNQSQNVKNGDNNIQLNIGSLAKGTYTIKAICAEGCETAITKFIKQ